MRGNIGSSIDIERRESNLDARRGVVYDCIGHILVVVVVGKKEPNLENWE